MKPIFKISSKPSLLVAAVTAVSVVYLAGCSLVAVPNNQTGHGHTADHPVINEVFTLPDSQYDAYSWVEIYNPTDSAINDFHQWSLEYTENIKTASGADSQATVRAYLTSFTGGIPSTLPAGYMLVLTGDSLSLMQHTTLGPATGSMAQFYVTRFRGSRLVGLGVFLLPETGQIALRDTSGNYVDVVRYGNYVAPTPDPFPSNHSAGMIPEWYSLDRYAYAYETGNSADDFYMAMTPTPLWFSERAHP